MYNRHIHRSRIPKIPSGSSLFSYQHISQRAVQLIAQFRIFPSYESRHSFVANYTSVVIFENVFWFVFVVLLSLFMYVKANTEMLSFNEKKSYFPHDPFDKGIFCTHVRICSLHISKKCFRLKCFYYQTFAFNMCSNNY